MSSVQATLDGDTFETDDEDDNDDDYCCPLCGTEIAKVNLSSHISSEECDSEHKEVRHDF